MTNLLQNLMAMVWKKQNTTPQTSDMIPIARYATTEEIGRPKPSIITRLVSLDKLKTFVNDLTTVVPYNLLAGNGGSSTMPVNYNLIDISWDGLGNGIYTLYLPTAASMKYRQVRIITDGTLDNGAQDVINITAAAGDTIDGVASVSISKRYEGVSIWSDGNDWIVIQAKAH